MASKGRTQRAASAVAKARRPNLSKYYGKVLRPVTGGEFDFRLDLLRGAGVPILPLDTYLESFEWVDEESSLTGNVQLHRLGGFATLPVARGHQVRCRVLWLGQWYELWTMRCGSPETNVDSGILSVDLKDDLDIVSRSKRRYVYRKTKRRKYGWFGHDILRDAAKKDGIKLGRITKCKKRMDKIDFTGTFLQLAVKIYENEQKTTASKYVLRLRNGRFEAVPYRRNDRIYVFSQEIRTALVHQDPKVANPVTVLTGKGRIGKGKGAKKVRHTEYRRDMVRRFGFSRKTKDFGRVKSAADLRAQVRADLAKQYKVDRTCTIQVQGVPFLRRGDGSQVVLAEDGFSGQDSYVFATGVRHQVQAGTYTSEADFTIEDAFAKDRERREKELRKKAREKRAKKTKKKAAT